MRNLRFNRTVGAGAFGTVYHAELISGQGFRRAVAVKVLLQRPDSEMFLARIRDEARLLGMLQDDAILKVLDMARLENRDAIIMEFVEGVDLEAIIEQELTIPPRALAEIGAAVAGALDGAHRATHPGTGEPLNVIHRDVKPSNIMLTASGGVKLLDFGVARAHFDTRESYTGQLVLGTLNYMAPEYIVTGEVSTAADVYGLGLSLWRSATRGEFGQPKVRRDAHDARLANRLSVLDKEYTPLAPLLHRMMGWDTVPRSDSGAIASVLQDAADEIRGPSLRSWARQVIPQVLGGRPEAEDSAGFVGRTLPLADSPETEPTPPPGSVAQEVSRAPPRPEVRQTRAPTPPQQPPPQARPGPAPAPTPASRKLPARKKPVRKGSLAGAIIKGLLIGGIFGMLLLTSVVLLLLFIFH